MSGADWSTPTIATIYTDVLANLNDKDEDAAQMFHNAATNIPVDTIKYDRTGDKFQVWNGSAWVDLILSIAGGGTSSSTASGARTALGLGSISTQDNNNVNITGGSISGVTMNASVITAGQLPLNRGGTGASLSIGSNGQVLKAESGSVVFGDGSDISGLNAANLGSGIIPLARLAGITNTQIDTSAAIDYSKLNLAAAIKDTDIIGVSGSKISGNIPGNASNINSYIINQDLGTSSSPAFNSVSANSYVSSHTGYSTPQYGIFQELTQGARSFGRITLTDNGAGFTGISYLDADGLTVEDGSVVSSINAFTGDITSGRNFIPGHGFISKRGNSGVIGGSTYNFYWNGTDLEIWIDITKLGTVNFTP